MILKVLGSSSKGNCYILESNSRESLIIECGVHFNEIKKAINFDYSKVSGAIVSHSHGDHSFSMKDAMAAGIEVYAGVETLTVKGLEKHHRAQVLISETIYKIGAFKVKPFNLHHDVPCFGYLINHPETGTILFLTDSYYCEYTFPGLNNVIIEANYCQGILDKRVADGMNPKFLRDRVITSHMSLKTCKEMLAANDLSAVNNIVLIHLSDGNSDEKRFKREVEEQTGKVVYVAVPGLTIPFNKTPF